MGHPSFPQALTVAALKPVQSAVSGSDTIWESSVGEASLLCCSDVRVCLIDCCQHVVFIVYSVSLWLSCFIVVFMLLHQMVNMGTNV